MMWSNLHLLNIRCPVSAKRMSWKHTDQLEARGCDICSRKVAEEMQKMDAIAFRV